MDNIRHENYEGCQISISDENGELIDKTVVIASDSPYGRITVRGRYPNIKKSSIVSVLIFTKKAIHEYSARISNSVMDSMASELRMFHGKELENRTAKRYRISNKVTVHSMKFGTKVIPLLNNMEAFTVNMSATGALLTAPQNSFAVGNVLKIQMELGDGDMEIAGEIVRETTPENGVAEFGCKFVFDDDGQEIKLAPQKIDTIFGGDKNDR